MGCIDWDTASFQDYCSREIALQYLCERLKRGCLSLFLGAGVSDRFGFPVWHELVSRCCSKVGIEDPLLTADTPTEKLLNLMGRVERKAKEDGRDYRDLVSTFLYGDADYITDVIQNKTLIALGALAMSSRRGSVTDIISLNFDDVLEWYLQLHGFTWQAVFEFPADIHACDVRIYHPHGFLPNAVAYPRSESLVFSEKSYLDRMDDMAAPWNTIIRSILLTKTLLFVGCSGRDIDIQLLLNRVLKEIGNSRPVAFAFFRTGLHPKEDTDDLVSKGVIPIYVDSYEEDLPGFLLEICQRAAGFA